MKAKPGDRIVVRAPHQGERDRDGEVLEVKGADGAPPYWVKWSDGHTGLYYPSADAYIAAPA
jgi:hypothetical protein